MKDYTVTAAEGRRRRILLGGRMLPSHFSERVYAFEILKNERITILIQL